MDQSWLVAGKRDAYRYAVFLARINQEVGSNGHIVHEGIAQQAEHCLASRKVAVISKLKAVGPVVDGVEDEHSLNVQLIVRRTVLCAWVMGSEKNDLSGFFT